MARPLGEGVREEAKSGFLPYHRLPGTDGREFLSRIGLASLRRNGWAAHQNVGCPRTYSVGPPDGLRTHTGSLCGGSERKHMERRCLRPPAASSLRCESAWRVLDPRLVS